MTAPEPPPDTPDTPETPETPDLANAGSDISDETLERRLRLRFTRTGNGANAGCPSPNLLAALIDGTLEDAERDETDRHAHACPVCRDTLADVRFLIAAQAGDPLTASPEVVTRARSLVRELPGPVVVRRVDFRSVSRWGLSAAASIAVCLVGYQAGARSSGEALPEPDLVAELTFGADLDATTEFELLLVHDLESLDGLDDLDGLDGLDGLDDPANAEAEEGS